MDRHSAVISPRELISATDTGEMLRFFAAVLEEAESARKRENRRSIMMPGPFWLLARQNPSVQDLHAYLDGVLPPGWPPWFRRNLEAIKQDPLRDAFQFCFKGTASSPQQTGRDACRVMAAVAQTLCTSNAQIVSRNRALAQSSAACTDPDCEKTERDDFISQRPDEHGVRVCSGNLTLWMASHIGPGFADKIENQDAVYATASGKGIVFALADGVSTSLGSRFAAATAAHRFCAEVQQLLTAAPADGDVLLEAARRTQRELDETLERILSDAGGPGMNMDVIGASSIQPSLASALLRNTQTAEKNFLHPALATTLIGGILERAVSGESRCQIIAIGDGAVEQIHDDGSVSQLLSTAEGAMEIAESLGPGPLSRKIMESGQMKSIEIVLHGKEYLLISSDGLTRGHQDAVYTKAAELIGDFRPRLTHANPAVADELLHDLVAVAEKRYPEAKLFEDNLSLILAGWD